MLLEKKQPHFLTSLFVRLLACLLLLVGIGIFVSSMVHLALGSGHFDTLIQGLLLILSAFLLLRLRSRGIRLLTFIVIFSYIIALVRPEDAFWPHFYFASMLLLLLCLLGLSYFALRRGEGRRALKRTRFFVLFLYIALTTLSLSAYYDEAFCAYRPALEFDPLRQELHVSITAPVAQWLFGVSCHDDGDLLFGRRDLP